MARLLRAYPARPLVSRAFYTYYASPGCLALQVTASADDAWEGSGGSVDVTITQAVVNQPEEWFGFRFQNVAVPQGATIISATLSVYLHSTFGSVFDEPKHTFYGHDTDSAPVFTAGEANTDISERPRTTASVLWDVADLGAPNSGGFYSPPDLKSIVQEIIDRSGWATGNALVIVTQGSDTGRDLGLDFYDLDPTHGAKLEICFTSPPAQSVSLSFGIVIS